MRQPRPYLADINVIPFVDVMLVLLAIFMITAPLMQHGMDVQLPQASTSPVEVKKVPTVTLKSNKTIYWDREEAADLQVLRGKLNEYVSQSQNGAIYFRADKTLDYGFIMKVLATIRSAGVQNIGMMTEPIA
ncbi:MAG: biopolymer transporter ExbD [Nitrospinae bacterium]|nr:biopolymer transporter ExbD [Nitrospinota bacterium]